MERWILRIPRIYTIRVLMGLHLETNWEPMQYVEHWCDMSPSEMLLRNGHCSFSFLGKSSSGTVGTEHASQVLSSGVERITRKLL